MRGEYLKGFLGAIIFSLSLYKVYGAINTHFEFSVANLLVVVLYFVSYSTVIIFLFIKNKIILKGFVITSVVGYFIALLILASSIR